MIFIIFSIRRDDRQDYPNRGGGHDDWNRQGGGDYPDDRYNNNNQGNFRGRGRGRGRGNFRGGYNNHQGGYQQMRGM